MNSLENINWIMGRIYTEAACKLNINYRIIDPDNLIQYSYRNKKWMLYLSRLPINTSVSAAISDDKYITNLMLKNANLPVAKLEKYKGLKGAIDYYMRNMKNKLVIKPNKGLCSRGITLLPKSNAEFIKGFRYAKRKCTYVLVERFQEGNNYRILVLDDRVLAVTERSAAYVVGDGVASINDLVKIENRKRSQNAFKKITIDSSVKLLLKSRNLSFNDIPRKNEIIFLRKKYSMSTGGITVDKTDDINEDNKKIAIRAVKILGLKFGGVDIITKDISKSLRKNSGIITEVNHNPGIRFHHYPMQGKSRDVASSIQQYMVKNY